MIGDADVDPLEGINEVWYDAPAVVGVLVDGYHLPPSIGHHNAGDAAYL